MVMGWLKTKIKDEDSHPLDNEKKSKEVFDSIRGNSNVQSALTEITQWLLDTTDDEALSLERKIDLVMELDSISKKPYELMLLDYMSGLKDDYSSYHFLVSRFTKALADAWIGIHTHPDFKNISAKIIKKHPSIKSIALVKSMRSCGTMIKWLRFQYKPVEASTWKNIASILASSVAVSGFDTKVELPGDVKQTSCQREFLLILMAEMTPHSTWLPLQIEVAHRIIRLYADHFSLSKTKSDEFYFAFDMERPREPFRVTEDTKSNALLYFPGNKYADDLNTLLVAIKEKKEINPFITAGISRCTSKDIEDIVSTLKKNWGATHPKRKHDRFDAKAHLSTFHSFNTIRSVIARVENSTHASNGEVSKIQEMEITDLKIYGFITEKTKELKEKTKIVSVKMLDSQLVKEAEDWIMDNVSPTGCGAYVASTGSWARVGVLVGFITEYEGHLSVGIIRRFSAAKFQQKHAGIEIISDSPKAIRLKPHNHQELEWEPAILLPENTYTGSEPAIIASPSIYRPGRILTISYRNGTKINVKLLERKEKFNDCELMTFHMLHTESD